MRSRTLVALIFVLGLQLAPAAKAGPVEQMSQLVLHPSNPNVMTVRYTWGGDGMLRTSDGGKSWQLLCDAMLFDPVQTHSGPLAMVGDGVSVMGVFNGLWNDDGHGCSWVSNAKYAGEWISDVVVHPSDPNVLFALTSTASPQGQHKLNGVIRRDASGTWSDVGTKEEMLFTRLHVVPHASGLRFYASAITGQVTPPDGGAAKPNYAIRVSDDEGKTWEEQLFGTTDGIFRVQGVDPKNPDRIIATINRTPQDNEAPGASDDSVLVSNDRGAHFTEYLEITETGGVAFAPDGRVWIGDLGSPSNPDAARGLWFAPNLDTPATKLEKGDYAVQCLGYQKATDTLYACQHFWFGSVQQGDGTFNSLIKFTEVKDFVRCSGVDVAASCQMQLCGAYCGFGHFAQAPVCDAYDTPVCGRAVVKAEGTGGTAGSSASGTGAAAGGAGNAGGRGATSRPDAGFAGQADAGTKSGGSKRGCACATAGAGSAPRLLAWGGLGLFVGLWVRRRGPW